jgi:hypothetical protein
MHNTLQKNYIKNKTPYLMTTHYLCEAYGENFHIFNVNTQFVCWTCCGIIWLMISTNILISPTTSILAFINVYHIQPIINIRRGVKAHCKGVDLGSLMTCSWNIYLQNVLHLVWVSLLVFRLYILTFKKLMLFNIIWINK